MKTTTQTRKLTAKKTTVAISDRVIREGNKISVEKLLESVNAPTRINLESLSKKFGIKWSTAYDNTLPKDAKSGPAHSFVIEGKTEDGKKVFYDRFQFMLFIDGHRSGKVKQIMSMNRKQFNKLVAA